MRLWSIHPEYLDNASLENLWQDALQAQHILQNHDTVSEHPQLMRFAATNNPAGAMASYLQPILTETYRRGFSFSANDINHAVFNDMIPVTVGQLDFEILHLKNILKTADPARYETMLDIAEFNIHPLFTPTVGTIEEWETKK